MSSADLTFIDNCKYILEQGISSTGGGVRPKWPDGTPAHTLRVFGLVNRYDLSREFPALTLRRLAFGSAVDEILWIWQKKSNNVNELNSKIWDAWADENGTLGKAYGYQLRQKHKYKEGMFDQVDRVLFELKNNPESRRILASMYNFDDLSEMRLYPCAYSLTFNVANGKLSAILNQRSQDFLIANNWNVSQYAVLLHMFAISCGLGVGELVHVIADAHIYDRHIPIVRELIGNEPRPAPRLVVNPVVKDFYDFKSSDFRLEGYDPHDFNKSHRFEVAV